MLAWFDDLAGELAGAFLQQWPSLQDAKRAHPGTLNRFFHEHNCRSEERIAERIRGIQEGTPATSDAAVLEACSMTTRGLVALLATLRCNIVTYEKRIEELVAAHPDGALFASLPGAGAALVPRLITAFGTHRDRFDSAYQVQCYSGIAPVTEASGKSHWVHFRWSCPKFFRQTFQEFAGQSIRQCEWARDYYQLQRDRHKSHHAAVRALAYKWIRIIFRCWKDGRPYDEQMYMSSVRRRTAVLGTALGAATGCGWKDVAGFKKFC